VISMKVIAEIRRRHLVSKESISSMARDLKLSRQTVRKHLQSDAEPVYSRQQQPAPKLGEFQDTLEGWLDRLIDAEQADRQVRSLRSRLKAARFPIHRDLPGVDWTETPLPQAQVQQLATAAFMENAHNLILVGGTGKTHSPRRWASLPSIRANESASSTRLIW
jgi:DNA replication protein DnaC